MSKKVFQLDEDGNIVREYSYITEVEKYGFKRRNVHKCLSGKFKRYRGYYWVYNIKDYKIEISLDKINGNKCKGYWTKERCIEEAKKYKSQKNFREGSGGSYDRARKEGWIKEICNMLY